MADETLIDKEISEMGDQLLENFAPDCVKGACYDIRVGAVAFLPPKGADGNAQSIALGKPPLQESVSIPPGSTCVIESREKVHMPQNMKGRLALRAFHARRLILFGGGVIDPGYDDHLYLPIANLGDTPIELKYEDKLVSAEFTKLLDKEAKPYEPGPKPHPRPGAFGIVSLSEQVQKQDESIRAIMKRLESSDIQIRASQRILDLVVLAVVAGGVIAVTAILLPGLSHPWNFIALAIGAVFIIVVVIFLIKSMPHRPER